MKLIRIVLLRVFLLCISFCMLGHLTSSVMHDQIYISKAGDGWDLSIDSALALIKNTDPDKYDFILQVCDTVEIWSGTFSSNNGSKSIIVSVNDIKLNSVNNLAAVLLHESMHLYFAQRNILMRLEEEERHCYVYEFEFLSKLHNLEPWLLRHTLKQIQNYTK